MSRVKRLLSLRPTVSVRLMPRYHMVTPISPAFVIQSRKFSNADPIPPTNSPSNDAKTATKTQTQQSIDNEDGGMYMLPCIITSKIHFFPNRIYFR